jgi:hypothetical protein
MLLRRSPEVLPDIKSLIVLLFFVSAAIANAAAMKEDALGCKDIASAKKLKETAKANSKRSRALGQSDMPEGACRWYKKNDVVEIDAEEGRFLCVRPPGALDCAWTPEGSVNRHPGYLANPDYRDRPTISHRVPLRPAPGAGENRDFRREPE